MGIIRNDSGQTAILFIFVGGLLLFGGIYILLGSFMGALVTTNNQLISSQSIAYSQDHKNAMDWIFRLWWITPILFILWYIYYMIKKGLEKKPEDLYG